MIYRVLAGLVVLAVLVGSVLLGRQQGESGTQKLPNQPADALGYAVRDARLVETGDDGRPLYTLDANLARQRPNDQRVQLDGPRMSFIAADGNRWTASGSSGQIHADGSHIELFGDVRLTGVLPGSTQTAQINTSILSFDSLTQQILTHAPVTIDWAGRELQASGLIANLKDHTVQLESRVHGTFTP